MPTPEPSTHMKIQTLRDQALDPKRQMTVRRDRAVQGVVTPLTTVQIIRLCDAAERAIDVDSSCWVPQAMLDERTAERDALAAQLTEITRERDAIQATYDEFCAKFPSKSVMRREAAMRDPEAALAPLRAVVEDLRSWLFEQFDIFKTRDNVTARAMAASFKDVIVKLDALSALPADPSAPTPR